MAQIIRAYAGEDLQTFQLQFLVSGAFRDITGATLTGRLRRTDLSSPTDQATTGVLTVLGGTSGNFSYLPSSADFAAAGVYELQVKATSGALISYADAIFVTLRAPR